MGYSSAPSTSGAGGGVTRTLFLDFGVPTVENYDGIHAQHRGDGANIFPGPITQPDIPRNVSVAFGGAYDGGDVTVSGLNQFGAAISEIIAAPAPAGWEQYVDGEKCFASITSISKAQLGADASADNYVSVGPGGKLGIVDDDVDATTNLIEQALGFRNAGGMVGAKTIDTVNKTIDFWGEVNGSESIYAIIGIAA